MSETEYRLKVNFSSQPHYFNWTDVRVFDKKTKTLRPIHVEFDSLPDAQVLSLMLALMKENSGIYLTQTKGRAVSVKFLAFSRDPEEMELTIVRQKRE